MFGQHANARLHTFYSKSSAMAVPECRETAMEHPVENEPVKLLTRAQLASTWAISPKTLADWEGTGVGPPQTARRPYQVRGADCCPLVPRQPRAAA